MGIGGNDIGETGPTATFDELRGRLGDGMRKAA
jgi:hypothetical protein